MTFLIILIILIIYFANNKKKQIQPETQQIVENQEAIIEPEYLKSENQIIEDIINQELQKNDYDGNDIKAVEHKRLRLTIIFSILNFIFVALIFFHLPKYVYLLEVINVWVYLCQWGRFFLTTFGIHFGWSFKKLSKRTVPTDIIVFIKESPFFDLFSRKLLYQRTFFLYIPKPFYTIKKTIYLQLT